MVTSVLALILHMHGSTSRTQKYIQTDKGGELAGSHAFQHLIQQSGCIIQIISALAFFSNGIAECPHHTLGDMMQSLLHGVKLSPEYWSWELLHATYLIKNPI